ncbi:MAG: AAA domain-containing protein [Desulfurococcales archaeon]|nr:AAA domain-containing protein [Desulfurococcales archaeon]
MARIQLCEALQRVVGLLSNRGRRLDLNESQNRALNLMRRAVEGSVEVPLGAIQGPPGTGKTSVVEAFAERVLSRFLDDIASKEIVIYVAPTNHLAVEAFTRISYALLAKGLFSVRDILDMTRVYGYKISPGDCKGLERLHGITEDMVRQVLQGYIEPGTVKLVFTTEFQRVSGRFRDKPDRVHLIVDEASKSPYFRAFLPMADYIMRYEGYPGSLVALGDPEQAIAVPEEFRRDVPLLMNKVIKLLDKGGLKDSNYVFLDTTYRLPNPSEEPISKGFYDGKLRAFYTSSYKLREMRYVFEDERRKVLGELNKLKSLDKETQLVHEALYNAVTSSSPIVILDTGKFTPISRRAVISTYDAVRARVSAKASLILQLYGVRGGFDVMAISPYSDMASNIQYLLASKYGSLIKTPPLSLTVHSVIGGEADAIVAVLGKEYPSSRGFNLFLDDGAYQTIYFNEPQVLNVQLSRHRRLMVVVGHLDGLTEPRRPRQWKKLSTTAEAMNKLIDQGLAVRVRIG